MYRRNKHSNRKIIKNDSHRQETNIKITEHFYKDLYKATTPNTITMQGKEKIGCGLLTSIQKQCLIQKQEEIKLALKQTKNNRARGEDKTRNKESSIGCLYEGEILAAWENSITILIDKKGDPTENNRPISLHSQMYKLFMKIITNRLEREF